MTLTKAINWSMVGLYGLGTISILSGALQLDMLQQGLSTGDVSHDQGSEHYYSMPWPVAIHIVTGLVFNLIAPLQFSQSIRRNNIKVHKLMGRSLAVCAILAGVTALLMNELYPAFGGWLKYSAVTCFAVGITGCTIMGIIRIRQKNIASHRAWMIRATALALGPATQRLFFIPAFLVMGSLSEMVIGLGVWIGFTVNLLVAEIFIIPRNKVLSQPQSTNAQSQPI